MTGPDAVHSLMCLQQLIFSFDSLLPCLYSGDYRVFSQAMGFRSRHRQVLPVSCTQKAFCFTWFLRVTENWPFSLITSGQLPCTSLIYQPFHGFVSPAAPSKYLISSLNSSLLIWNHGYYTMDLNFPVLHPFPHSSFSYGSPISVHSVSKSQLLWTFWHGIEPVFIL